jgi:hypothetical protein
LFVCLGVGLLLFEMAVPGYRRSTAETNPEESL